MNSGIQKWGGSANQALSVKLIEIEKELDASSLKLRELEVVHDRQETELVTKEQVISDLTENYLRFKYNKSGLRRIIEDKDRLLGSKEAELIAQRDRHTKTVEDLLERIREKTSWKIGSSTIGNTWRWVWLRFNLFDFLNWKSLDSTTSNK